MEKQRDLLFFCLVLSCSSSFLPWVSSSEGGPDNVSPKRLFVFGDSYADTGNTEKSSGAWHQPYGATFPGEPSGRFSDGLVLTDYVASFLGIKSPQPYRWRNDANETLLQHGMNFAYGGTGVFDTMAREPNMTTQIDYFQSLVEQNVYIKHDLSSSVALVSLAGNDYAAFAMKNAKREEELPSFITSVIDQLVHDLKRIKGLGVGKIAVTALEPLGCLPQLTAVSSFKNCSSNYNTITRLHNHKLHRSLQELKKNESMVGLLSPSWASTLVVLDLHTAFVSALSMLRHQSGNLSENPLKPCCVGATEGYSCGNVGDKGVKNYVLCDHPETSFFWDNIHPSQNGWRTVYSFLHSSLHHLL